MANVLSAVVLCVCFVIALIVVNARTEHRARVLGVLGVVVVFGTSMLATLNGSVGLWLTNARAAKVDVYGLGLILVAGIGAVGVVLLALAVVAARRAVKDRFG